MKKEIIAIAEEFNFNADQLEREMACAFREFDSVDKMLDQTRAIKAIGRDIVSRARMIELYLIDAREKGNEA